MARVLKDYKRKNSFGACGRSLFWRVQMEDTWVSWGVGVVAGAEVEFSRRAAASIWVLKSPLGSGSEAPIAGAARVEGPASDDGLPEISSSVHESSMEGTPLKEKW
jgi:hypothetical protein